MGVLSPRRAGPGCAEAERRVGVAADANWLHQISTIHLNFLTRQKCRLVPGAGFTKDFGALTAGNCAKKARDGRATKNWPICMRAYRAWDGEGSLVLYYGLTAAKSYLSRRLIIVSLRSDEQRCRKFGRGDGEVQICDFS